MVGIPVSFWDGLFSGVMLNFGRVSNCFRKNVLFVSTCADYLSLLSASFPSCSLPFVGYRLELPFSNDRSSANLSLLYSSHRIHDISVNNYHKDQPKVGQYIIHGSYGIGCTLLIFTYASEFARAKDVRLSLLVQVHRRFHVPLSGSCTYRMQLASVLGVVVLFSNNQPPRCSTNEMYCLHLSQNHGKGIGTYSGPMEQIWASFEST